MDAEIQVDARDHLITGVTVYRSNGALVKRRFQLNVKSGRNGILIKCLSPVLDGDSIRVEAETISPSQGLTIFDVVSYSPITHTHVPHTVQTPEMEDLENQKAELRVRVKAVEHHHALLKGYSKSLSDGRVENVTAEGLFAFMNIKLEKDMELWKEKRKLEKDIKILEDKIAGIRITEKHLPIPSQCEVKIVLLAEETGPIEILLSYVVTDASWSSFYDIHADLSGNSDFGKSSEILGPTVKLHYHANITQLTQENWENVALTLSTASPLLGSEVPKAQPWRITAQRQHEYTLMSQLWGFNQPGDALEAGSSSSSDVESRGARSRRHRHHQSTESSSRSNRSRSEERSSEDDVNISGPPPPPAPVRFDAGPKVHINDGPMSSMFVIDGPSDIPGDGKTHKVSIASVNFSSQFEWVSVPRSLPSAFLQCRMKNESSYTLIAGPSAVFFDGNFVARSFIPDVSPSELFTCSLGIDPAVRITFPPQIKVVTSREKQAISSRRRINSPKTTVTLYEQHFSIRNTRPSKSISTLVVKDRVPVSENADIQVTLLHPSADALGPVTGAAAKESALMEHVGEPEPVDHISKNVIARWACKGDGMIEWVVTDLHDSVDLHIAFEVACPPGIHIIDAN
ncbi:hypothetical protein DL93DRAFT_2230081 [Clavulina sp. PMI_390]|nr:hypothetical protein DL93DRAFT_2230081 [Clavulina sp. PMI_390]